MRPEAQPAFEKDAALFLAAPQKVNASLTLLSLRVGEKDFALPGMRNLSELLETHGFDVVYEESAGGHTWINWRKYLRDLAPRLFVDAGATQGAS